jgi:Asp/Glu/hydantoin racemase
MSFQDQLKRLKLYKPVRALKMPLEQFREENQVLNNFLDLAKEAINDGANVILTACCNTSRFFTYKGVNDIDGIPIIDGVIAALKLAEILVDFKNAGLWKSKKNKPNDIKEFLRNEYYYGLESV